MSMNNKKSLKVCHVLGGLDVARYISSNARYVFRLAIEDVELIREYVSLAVANEGIVGGMSSLKALNNSLDWEGRGLEKGTTTVDAGLGYSDDRMDRMIDRYISLKDQPLIGDKETDMRIADTLSNLFPWIVDRRSSENRWFKPHQNGRSSGNSKAPLVSDTLYTAAWIGTYGNAWLYYPPLSVHGGGKPFGVGDVFGDSIETREYPFVSPNLPENNPSRVAFLADPYPDKARPGMSLITALAPIYLNATFGSYTYNDTYFASTGVDIAVDSTSSLLDTLLDTMTPSSFAVLVDIKFNMIVISQAVVERLYPPRTGFEESRVTYDVIQGKIVEDRRNQTYLVSDTIHQGLTKLENANWQMLQQEIKQFDSGDRGYVKLNLTLTGEVEEREFYVMFERWADVADWVMLAFAPVDEVEGAIEIGVYESMSGENSTLVTLQGEWGHDQFGTATIVNSGSLDVIVTTHQTPEWFALSAIEEQRFSLPSGSSMPLQFKIESYKLPVGVSSFLLSFTIDDDDYPDCFYTHDISLPIIVTVLPKDCATVSGDPMRVASGDGSCVCSSASVEIGRSCVRYSILFPSIIVSLFLLGLLFVRQYVRYVHKQSDYVWFIKSPDLTYDEPPEILGRGTFGLVVRAEYRGTKVAVKRVIPSLSTNKDSNYGTFPLSSRSSIAFDKRVNVESIEYSVETWISKLFFWTASKRTYPEIDDNNFDFCRGVPVSNDTFTSNTSHEIVASLRGIVHELDRSDFRIDAVQYAKLQQDFVQEMRLLSKLRHPCVTTIMGAVIDYGHEPLLVMELMDLGSLFDLLRNETMVIEGHMVLQVLRDVAQGMRYLHAAKPQVVHGDLKAQNILVDCNFRAKISDFGLSLKKSFGATGTPYWMAPEVLSGMSTNTAACDVYSFGITLYEVYSRRIPYEGEDFSETIDQVCDPMINKRPPVPHSMPMEIERLMKVCIRGDPNQRPTFVEIDKQLKSFSVGTVEPFRMRSSRQVMKSFAATLASSENLLSEIFPKYVAEALSRGEKVEPEHFDCVTVLFSTIVGFAKISCELGLMKLSNMLDRLYTEFDRLSRKHSVFKVETVGDEWMGVTNVAWPQSDHAKRIAVFAMDAIRAANVTMVDEEDPSKGYVQIRVGFHSGPVVAHILGSRNSRYSLIGDTVNTASRMASNSRAGYILCSKASEILLKEQAPELHVVPRELIEVKGKGLMETFWVAKHPSEHKGERKSSLKEDPVFC